MVEEKKYNYRMYLVRRRLELNISINKLCKLTDTLRQQYYRFEKGTSGAKISLMYFAKIVMALGFDLTEAYYLEKQYEDSIYAREKY